MIWRSPTQLNKALSHVLRQLPATFYTLIVSAVDVVHDAANINTEPMKVFFILPYCLCNRVR